MTANLLLQTKLYIPRPRPEWVPRPRLLEKLHQGLARKLTLVSAPPGSGKTALLSEWAGECMRLDPTARVAWLSLDEGDNETRLFWSYLVSALRAAVGAETKSDLGSESLALLQAPELPPLPTILVPLLNELAALPGDLVLVLDDYHVLSESLVHEGMAYLVERLPAQTHLVLSTRADPPLPLHRLRARGQLVELRAADLRFTPDEAAAFLNSAMGLGLEPHEVETLETRTEGWIVGLQLAALSLQGRADRRAFIDAFGGSHHYVLEYLTEEVVQRQTEPVRRFLARTAILDRLCGPLCNAVVHGAVTGQDDGEAMLADLSARNLFVVPLDDERRWYRYHHLFADLLGNLLRKEQTPEQIATLNQRASEWHEQNGDEDAAIRYALRARAYDRAADLIEQSAQAHLSRGQLRPLLRWVEALPEDVLRERLGLRLYYGWTLNLSGRLEDGAQVLYDTRADLSNRPPSPETQVLRARLAALLTGVAMLRQDPATVVQEAQEALAYLPDEDDLSRARVYVALGTAHAYRDETQAAVQTWRQARDLALQAGNPFLATSAIEMLAGTLIYHQGDLRAAERDLQTVLERATAPDGGRLPFSCTAHALLAEIYLEWNQLDRAEGYLKTGRELLRQSGICYGRVYAACAQARLAHARGDPQEALHALREAGEALDEHGMTHMALYLAGCQVRLRLCLGDVGTAARWAAGVPAPAGDPATTGRALPETLPRYLREVQCLSLARVALARGNAEQALAVLDGLEAQALDAGRKTQAIEAALLQALALQAEGQQSDAVASLARSLSLAEPEGYQRLYLEAGPGVLPLLRQAAAQGICPSYTSELLAAWDVQEIASAAPQVEVRSGPDRASARPPGALLDPLTPREQDVLRLICAGLSNREIAEQLTVTLNTVKKHTSNLYSKLGVRSRTQAIARAQALDLL